jgi:hypothetical protein
MQDGIAWSRLCTKLHYGVVRTGGRFEPKARRLRIMLRQAVEEHCFEKRFVYLDSTVVVNESQPAKAVHEEADA